MTKKSKDELTAKFPVNINEIYPNFFKNRNTAIRCLTANFYDNSDFISFPKKRHQCKHSPASIFLLTKECADKLQMIGGGL